MKPSSFRYERAGTLEEALALLAELGDEAKIIAGGQSLVPMMNFRLARPSALIDINRVDGLSFVERNAEGLRIGGLTRHEAVGRATSLDGAFAVLPRTVPLIGHYPIRVRGTFGGSLAHADPAAEWCLLALLLDGDIRVQRLGGERSIPVSSFFSSFLSTAIEPDELLTEVRFRPDMTVASLREFARREGDFAVVAAGVALDMAPDGRCRAARIALGGVAGTPVRITSAEQALLGTSLDQDVVAHAADLVARNIDPAGDVHGSAAYRRRVASALVIAAIGDCRASTTRIPTPDPSPVPWKERARQLVSFGKGN